MPNIFLDCLVDVPAVKIKNLINLKSKSLYIIYSLNPHYIVIIWHIKNYFNGSYV